MPSSTTMRLGVAAYAPQGYIRFCERRPDQCGLPSPIAADDRAQLERVLNQQQWANVFNPQPTAIKAEAATTAIALATEGAVAPGPDLRALIAPSPSLAPPALAPLEPEVAIHSAGLIDALTPHAPGKATLHMTAMVWAALNGINQSVNARIRPMSDEQAFGVADYWTLPLSDGPRPVGNCKHYALEKRKALVDAGFSADALSLAIVKTGWGEVHAVLIVDTDQGDYVLDNLSPWIKGWEAVRYAWIERQTPGEPLRWATLSMDAKAAERHS